MPRKSVNRITKEFLAVKRYAESIQKNTHSIKEAETYAYERTLEYQRHEREMKIAKGNLRKLKERKLTPLIKREQAETRRANELADYFHHREIYLIARYVLELKKGHQNIQLLRQAASARKAWDKIEQREIGEE